MKRVKRVRGIIYALLLTIGLVIVGSSQVSAEEWNDVSTIQDLANISNDLEGNYRLVNDIDLSEVLWTPIDGYFKGIFDGNGHTISNLTVDTSENAGLFGGASGSGGATFTNVTIKDVQIENSGSYTGALFGRATSGDITIDGVSVIGGTIKGGQYVGGIAGTVGSSASITNSRTELIVEGSTRVGGLVGDGGNIHQSYSSSSVTGTGSYTGGLVGYQSSNTIVSNSFSIGDVTGRRQVGGLVGTLGSKLEYSYSTGSVIATEESIGGLIGYASYPTYIKSAFALNSKVEGSSEVGQVIGSIKGSATIEQLHVLDSMDTSGHSNNVESNITLEDTTKRLTYTQAGFDFGLTTGTPIWQIDEGSSLPYLTTIPVKVVYDQTSGTFKKESDVDGGGSDGGSGDDGSDGGGSGDGGSDGDTGSGDGGTDGGTDGETGGGSDGGDSSSDEDVDLGLEGGNLFLETTPILSFGNLKLGSEPKTFTTSMDGGISVTDLRGTQEGWRLDVESTTFKVVEPETGFKSGTSAYELPVGSLSIAPFDSITRVSGSGTGSPSNSISSNTIIDDGSITLAEASSGEGTGVFDLQMPSNAFSLVIDSTTARVDKENYPNDKTPYKATVTWNLVSAP